MAHSNRAKICTWRAFDTPLSSLQLDIEQLACTHSAGNHNKLFAPEHLLITLYCCSIEVFSVCLKWCRPPPQFSLLELTGKSSLWMLILNTFQVMRSVHVKVITKALFCLFLSLCDVTENEYPCLVCGQLRLIDLTLPTCCLNHLYI